MVYVNSDGSLIGDGCSAYMKYENFLRAQESSLASVIGVDGGIDAIRRELYRPMAAADQSDFVLPLAVAAAGFRVIYEPGALIREHSLSDHSSEYRMRVRVALRAMWALWDHRRLLVPWPRPLLAWQIWSHKVLRYLAFLPILGALASCAVLAYQHEVYRWALALVMLPLGVGVVTWLRGGRGNRLFVLPYYLLLLNVSSAHAFFKWLGGKKQAIWVPRVG
jgi:hypothetical protein